jgi:hypothetical protein
MGAPITIFTDFLPRRLRTSPARRGFSFDYLIIPRPLHLVFAQKLGQLGDVRCERLAPSEMMREPARK